jgi:hypothetical protein
MTGAEGVSCVLVAIKATQSGLSSSTAHRTAVIKLQQTWAQYSSSIAVLSPFHDGMKTVRIFGTDSCSRWHCQMWGFNTSLMSKTRSRDLADRANGGRTFFTQKDQGGCIPHLWAE